MENFAKIDPPDVADRAVTAQLGVARLVSELSQPGVDPYALTAMRIDVGTEANANTDLTANAKPQGPDFT